MSKSEKKQVLCPIEKDGKTFWKRMGIAFVNRDNSLNVHLDGLPVNGKLQIREWEDEPRTPRPPGGAVRSQDGGGELPF